VGQIGSPGENARNYPVEVLNRWQKPGDVKQYARYTTQPQESDINYLYHSDGIYKNGSYIRLQNLALSYDVPAKQLKKISLIDCRVYLRAENLFLITKYSGLDPDVPFGSMPLSKVITGGIQFNF
jgi:hypothetical protein